MSGNQDRGREQLDQVSPLYIDSFFPFVCVRLRKESVSTVSVLQASLTNCSVQGHQETCPALVATVVQCCHLKNEQDG